MSGHFFFLVQLCHMRRSAVAERPDLGFELGFVSMRGAGGRIGRGLGVDGGPLSIFDVRDMCLRVWVWVR